MHLHNFLVDFRNSLNDPLNDKLVEEEIFNYDRLDNGIMSTVITSDSNRPAGRPSNDEVECLQRGLLLRHHLKVSLQNHNMQRPCNDE